MLVVLSTPNWRDIHCFNVSDNGEYFGRFLTKTWRVDFVAVVSL
ncbi:hypothetical protein M758_11G115700 [Ceratodon purpureus]|nr:hypothetical protein M758_11G115700 [Ceratodon purpureus]